jgi:hypothetical protein
MAAPRHIISGYLLFQLLFTRHPPGWGLLHSAKASIPFQACSDSQNNES